MSKKRSSAELKRRAAVDSALHAAFPLAFATDSTLIRPLAIGTREDVVAWVKSAGINGIGKKSVFSALYRYCSKLTYRKKIIAGAPRINLQGEVVDVVTAEAEAHARKYIEQAAARQAQAAAEKAEHKTKADAEKAAAQASAKSAPKPTAKPVAATAVPVIKPVSNPIPSPTPAPTVIVKKKRRIVTSNEMAIS